MQDTEIKSLPLEDCEEYLEGREYDLFVGLEKCWFGTRRRERRPGNCCRMNFWLYNSELLLLL